MRGWALAFVAVAMLAAGAVQAAPALVASSPANDATVARTAELTLGFSETVEVKASGVDLVMTGMPGMAGAHRMRVPLKIAATADRKGLVLTAKAPLPAGNYTLGWYTAGADGKRVAGSVGFAVK
ncbi:copper resistance protein CopC [Sphingomonas naphthae]|uniref:Copper resistance protein CopC n=1 Tax=Sphingomonas naphthae TaxID=1813468 RepID=A0ABY7TLG6_9SPHN|nr:copper resistance protein CopC [Sphingomonas naphthae]WCT74087.1 copper resistance protein CopC [Sphingomonas naphthae]